MTAARLSLVVSTVGRADPFRRLLRSLEDQPDPTAVEVVLVDQSEEGRCAAVVAERRRPFAVTVTTSGPGASVGRNEGLRHVTGDVVGFPDDDAWFPPWTPAAVLTTLLDRPDLAGVCGQQQTADGRPSMLRWPARATNVTRRNVLRTGIMSTMFFRRSALDVVGGFDEALGVGAPGWHHAGEETDLVLRVVTGVGPVAYDPAIVVRQEEPRDVPAEAFVRKMLEYGCGNGHLWRTRGLPRSTLAWYLARKVVGAGVRGARGERVLARADLAWLRGNVAGWRGRPPAELADLA